ncbi:MAG: lycopene cyclase family protein [Solirubrobacteraceae bacterium]
MTDSTFDVIVVGAGSAGTVLATRLSENPERRVLLIEAGAHYRFADEFPAEMRHAGVMRCCVPGHPGTWKFATTLAPGNAFVLPPGRGECPQMATYPAA